MSVAILKQLLKASGKGKVNVPGVGLRARSTVQGYIRNPEKLKAATKRTKSLNAKLAKSSGRVRSVELSVSVIEARIKKSQTRIAWLRKNPGKRKPTVKKRKEELKRLLRDIKTDQNLNLPRAKKQRAVVLNGTLNRIRKG